MSTIIALLTFGLLFFMVVVVVGFSLKSDPPAPRAEYVAERKRAAHNYIDSLTRVDAIEIDGHRLPDGRTETRITVVGFTPAEPWLTRHYQEHPST